MRLQSVRTLTWDEFDVAMDTMAVVITKAVESEKIPAFDAIYGIPRSGMPLAVALSHRLLIPFAVNPGEWEGSVLVCDDISDTGRTLNEFKLDPLNRTRLSRKRFENMTITTMTWIVRSGTSCIPDLYFVKENTTDKFVFPWER